MKTSGSQREQLHCRIAVFGAAFNPPHCGHEDVIKQALGHSDLVLIVPSYRHAFGKVMAPFELRLSMVGAMASTFSQHGDVRVSPIERVMFEAQANDKPIYTYDVLSHLEAAYPNASLVFVLGPDNAKPATWKTFYRANDILERWSIWEAQERIAVRSTDVRKKLAKGILPTETECPGMVIDVLKKTNSYLDGN